MPSVKRRRPDRSLAWVFILLLAVSAFSGCNQAGGPRPDQVAQVAQLPNKAIVAKFAGHVSIDGQPPSQDNGTLFVVLNDPAHPVAGGKASTTCDEQGNFAFTTYLPGDGAQTGKYVATFAQLKIDRGQSTGGHGRRMAGPSMSRDYVAPDGLKNLYNDPEKNKDNPSFVVEIAAPGRADYDFNLEVAGKESVKAPGTYAATRLRTSIAPKL
jgi:hypothetical protein